VLYASVVKELFENHHRDTEDTEVAQRRSPKSTTLGGQNLFGAKAQRRKGAKAQRRKDAKKTFEARQRFAPLRE